MIVLSLEQEVSASPYFDIHHMQRCEANGTDWLFSGTLGDGWYEGEVSVTLGSEPCVAFADEWFDPTALAEFFTRVDREQLCKALYRALAVPGPDACPATAGQRSINPHWHIEAGHGSISCGENRWCGSA